MGRRAGPKQKISPWPARVLTKAARDGGETATMVLNGSGVGVSLRAVERVLQNHARLEFGHPKATRFSMATT